MQTRPASYLLNMMHEGHSTPPFGRNADLLPWVGQLKAAQGMCLAITLQLNPRLTLGRSRIAVLSEVEMRRLQHVKSEDLEPGSWNTKV